MFGSVRGGNYGSVGQQINKQNQYLNEVNMKTSPDYGKIAGESIKGRSRERQAAIEAEAQVAKVGLDMKSQLKAGKIKLDAEKAARNAKKPAKRMAGIVAAAGALGGAFVQKKFNDEAKARDDKRDSDMEARIEALKGAYEGYKPPEMPEYEAPPQMVKPDLIDPDTSSGTQVSDPITGTSKKTSTSTSSATPAASQTLTTLQPGDQGAAFKKIHDIASKVGGTKFPEIVAAQAMHETGFLNPNIKSVYNSSGGTNPFGQTGDRGYGTIPRPGHSKGWTKYPSLEVAVKDHIKLWHDTNNHAGNYNAYDSARAGLDSVIPSYSPNSDPDNVKNGFTENKYKSAVIKILNNNGYTL